MLTVACCCARPTNGVSMTIPASRLSNALPIAVCCVSLFAIAGSGWGAEAVLDDKLAGAIATIDGLGDKLTEKDGRYSWSDGKAVSMAVVEVSAETGQLVVESDGEKVSVPAVYVTEGRGDLASALPGLVKA